MIYIYSKEEIEAIRASGRLAALTLNHIEKYLVPGVTTKELDAEIHKFIISHNAIPATLGYRGYPGSSCISINEEVVHGIPGSRVVKDGDLVKIDVTTIYKGYYGDTARTYAVGNVTDIAKRLLEATKESLFLAIDTVKEGSRVGDIGAAVQSHVEPLGFSVVKDFVGHGVGKTFHDEPNIPHYGRKGSGIRLKAGMVFTIEPMINSGDWRVKVLQDGWTAVTIDGSLSSQFEHTVTVTEDGCDILTLAD